MSVRGIRQLKELLIRYSDRDGSSEGIRHWMHLRLVGFAQNNPTITIRTTLKRNKHPTLTGVYLNGNSKTVCVRNEDQEEIADRVLFLRNQAGKKITTGFKKPWYSSKPSIQGEWHERMDVINVPLQITHTTINL